MWTLSMAISKIRYEYNRVFNAFLLFIVGIKLSLLGTDQLFGIHFYIGITLATFFNMAAYLSQNCFKLKMLSFGLLAWLFFQASLTRSAFIMNLAIGVSSLIFAYSFSYHNESIISLFIIGLILNFVFIAINNFSIASHYYVIDSIFAALPSTVQFVLKRSIISTEFKKKLYEVDLMDQIQQLFSEMLLLFEDQVN